VQALDSLVTPQDVRIPEGTVESAVITEVVKVAQKPLADF
jgi:hypothetical protein